jgi:PilZ domain-containing protein
MPDRRLVPRLAFGGVAEIVTAHPYTYMVVSTAELSRHGCFVDTYASLPVGTEVTLKITYAGRVFNARGEVTYALPEKGMGIRFTITAPKDVETLETWLREQTKF